MTYQVVSPKVQDDSLFFAEHQVWSFSADGSVRNIASTKPQRISEIMALFKTMPQQTTFQFAKDGVLFIQRSQADRDVIIVSFVTEDLSAALRAGAPLLKKGELILSYLGAAQQPSMQRYLTPLAASD